MPRRRCCGCTISSRYTMLRFSARGSRYDLTWLKIAGFDRVCWRSTAGLLVGAGKFAH